MNSTIYTIAFEVDVCGEIHLVDFDLEKLSFMTEEGKSLKSTLIVSAVKVQIAAAEKMTTNTFCSASVSS